MTFEAYEVSALLWTWFEYFVWLPLTTLSRSPSITPVCVYILAPLCHVRGVSAAKNLCYVACGGMCLWLDAACWGWNKSDWQLPFRYRYSKCVQAGAGIGYCEWLQWCLTVSVHRNYKEIRKIRTTRRKEEEQQEAQLPTHPMRNAEYLKPLGLGKVWPAGMPVFTWYTLVY